MFQGTEQAEYNPSIPGLRKLAFSGRMRPDKPMEFFMTCGLTDNLCGLYLYVISYTEQFYNANKLICIRYVLKESGKNSTVDSA